MLQNALLEQENVGVEINKIRFDSKVYINK